MSIILEKVSKSFGSQMLFSSFSLEIPSGSRVCFTGNSGCGKTTLLRMICGLDTDFTGKIHVPSGTQFACDFQEDRLLPWYTSLESLKLTGSQELAEELLQEAGLTAASGKYPDELSGGMRRRIALIRALIFPSQVLLLDEPVRELDKSTSDKMLELIEKHIGNRTLLLVTHDINQAEKLGCQTVKLSE